MTNPQYAYVVMYLQDYGTNAPYPAIDAVCLTREVALERLHWKSQHSPHVWLISDVPVRGGEPSRPHFDPLAPRDIALNEVEQCMMLTPLKNRCVLLRGHGGNHAAAAQAILGV